MRKLKEFNKGKSKPYATGSRNYAARKVLCITTGEVFECIKDAERKYNIASSSIIKCCKGILKIAGKLPDGTKLIWRYV